MKAIQMTNEEVLSPLFARFLVQSFSSWQTNCWLQESIPTVELTVSGAQNLSVVCKRTPTHSSIFAGETRLNFMDMDFSVEKIGIADWTVQCQIRGARREEVKTPFWKCPQSANMAMPPLSGWKAVHGWATGKELRLEYIYSNHY